MDKSVAPVDQITVRSSTCYEFSNPNEAKVVELEDYSVDIVERKMEDLKLDHQFNEENVPRYFRILINKKKDKVKEIKLYVFEKTSKIVFHNIKVHWKQTGNDWMISYINGKKTIRTDDPEKSIVDHLWFVLRNPKVMLSNFSVLSSHPTETKNASIDSEKLNAMLPSMLDSIDHQIRTHSLCFYGFNEDTFSSILEHCKPRVLEEIYFIISWKVDGNYQKLERIVEMNQWKHAQRIYSSGVSSLKVEDLLHCESFSFVVSPENVPRVKEKYFDSTNSIKYSLNDMNRGPEVDIILKLLEIVFKVDSLDAKSKHCNKIDKAHGCLLLFEHEDTVFIHKL